MKLRWFVVIAFLNFILQSVVFEQFRLFGIAPNTALILIVGASLIFGVRQGLVLASVAGILQDIFFSKALGEYTLVYCLVALALGLLEGKLYKDNWLTPITSMTGATLCFHVLFLAVAFFSRDIADFQVALFRIFPIEALLNTLVFMVFYRRIYRRAYGYGLN